MNCKVLVHKQLPFVVLCTPTWLHHKDSEYARAREHCRNFYGIDLM